ncbi:MAG TPA: J domain-containing protein [Pseudonocardiaceae bacterium]|nr:J domain-containing protein [Pseudonocardiaceae bacterium]
MTPSSRPPDPRGAHQRAADLYAVLGVSPDAEIGELTSAYRRRLRQLHPDTRRQHRADEQPDQLASPSLAEVLHAYAVLRDPTRRARYDHARTAEARTDPASCGASSSGAVPIPVRHRRSSAANSPQPWIRVGPVRRHLLPD